MCGIAGVYGEQNSISPALIEKIAAFQKLRGPDHQALLTIPVEKHSVIFAHNRLRVLDLSDDANQPMWDATQRYCLVYNGEIYNYVELRNELKKLGYHFRTASDTEVILHAFAAWQEKALEYFKGPFAFALFDTQTKTLWLCRDRFGKKPLFYLLKNNMCYFASSVSELAKHFNCSPNLNYIARGLHYWIYENGSEETQFQDIHSVKAAHYLRIHFANNEIKSETACYYRLAENVQKRCAEISNISLTNATEQLLSLFTNAIQQRLRADVPIGISLSGGLDSSAVAAFVKQNNPQLIEAFTFGHPSQLQTEAPLAKELAEKLAININYIWPNVNEWNEVLLKTLHVQEAPFASSSVMAQYLIYQAAKSKCIKVLLGGQGGDEVFMGYRKYFLFAFKKLLQGKNYLQALFFASQLIPMLFSEKMRWRSFWQQRYRYQNTFKEMTTTLNLPNVNSVDLTNAAPNLWQRQAADIEAWSLPTLLRYEDRNSLGNSVESRLPFLDHELVEFGLALPTALKLHKGYGKWLVREALENFIPDSIRLARYKRGFDITLSTFVTQGFGQAIRHLLMENKETLKNYFSQSTTIETAFSDQQLLHAPRAFTEAISLLWLSRLSS